MLGKVKIFHINFIAYLFAYLFIYLFWHKLHFPLLTSFYRNFVRGWHLPQFLQKLILLKISANFKWIDIAIIPVFHVIIVWIWGESNVLWIFVRFYWAVQLLPHIANILFSWGCFYPTLSSRAGSSCQYLHQIFIVQSCELRWTEKNP